MKGRTTRASAALLSVAAMASLATGCTVKPPTIAHVHVGHAVTGWRDTPNKEGLLVTAEQEAGRVLDTATEATENCRDLTQAREEGPMLVALIDPPVRYSGEAGQTYGLRRAVEGAINHLEFAAESDDASDNVRLSVPTITVNARQIMDRVDEVYFLSPALASSRSTAESCEIAGEIRTLATSIVDGAATEEYGLAQMRQDIAAMIAEERPPYTTVDSWYLLNLVRLPSGKWGFDQWRDDGGGGGGGY